MEQWSLGGSSAIKLKPISIPSLIFPKNPSRFRYTMNFTLPTAKKRLSSHTAISMLTANLSPEPVLGRIFAKPCTVWPWDPFLAVYLPHQLIILNYCAVLALENLQPEEIIHESEQLFPVMQEFQWESVSWLITAG